MSHPSDPTKFRASWTVLNAWARGYWNDAIKSYFWWPIEENEAMRFGKQKHEEWRREVEQTGRIPAIWGIHTTDRGKVGRPLNQPRCEDKFVVPIPRNPWLELVVKIDCYEPDTIIEWKTGVKSAADYLNELQMPLYALARHLTGQQTKKVEVYAHNQHNNKNEFAMMWLDDDKLREAAEFMITNAAEMYQYLRDNGLFSKMPRMVEEEKDRTK